MQDNAKTRRSYGTGSLFVRRDTRNRDVWYGQWRTGRSLVKRRLGLKRERGTKVGLTKAQAERELRRRMQTATLPSPAERLTIADVGERYLEHLFTVGRKRSTLIEYESVLLVHLAPFFAEKAVDRLDRSDVQALIAAKAREGKSPKTIRNQLGLLHSIFAYAERQGWRTGNPCKLVEKPRDTRVDADIRFLQSHELEALLDAIPADAFGPVERTLYLTGAMTGLRQGELLGLRWRDVDWVAGRVRVRQSYVRGEFGTPKSKRSSRSVPLADRVAAELDQLFQRSAYQADEHLVFGHPQLGKPLDRSKVLKRFKAAARRARLQPVRFHDLRHTFGTCMAAAGVPMRTLQEWMGHRDYRTTLIYADYAPSAQERDLVERAFRQGINSGIKLSETETNSDQEKPRTHRESGVDRTR